MSTPRNSRRVTLKIEAVADSPDAKLLNHVKQDPITPSREVALRALKAFYLPWALEGKVNEGDLTAIAQSAIEELQFRIFQIRQRYLSSDPAAYRPATVSESSTSGVVAANGRAAPPTPDVSLAAMRESINPADLDDF